MSKLAIFAFAVAAPFPWRLRRLILQAMCGFVIPQNRIHLQVCSCVVRPVWRWDRGPISAL